eukprot:8446959-Alexandrium_andersonii.AAC.1
MAPGSRGGPHGGRTQGAHHQVGTAHGRQCTGDARVRGSLAEGPKTDFTPLPSSTMTAISLWTLTECMAFLRRSGI